MAAPRPNISDITTLRLTAADKDALAAIAAAMHAQNLASFPTRSAAIRFSIDAVRQHLRHAGRLPTSGRPVIATTTAAEQQAA